MVWQPWTNRIEEVGTFRAQQSMVLFPEVAGLVEAVLFKPGEREFGLVLATAVAISSFVALTLVPAMAAHLTQAQQPDGAVAGRIKTLGGRPALAY